MKIRIFVIFCLISAIFSTNLANLATAGTLNLTILNEDSRVEVIKYLARYGYTEEANPENYPYCTEIIPDEPTVGKFHGDVEVVGNGVGICMSVKDIYIDPKTGQTKETEWSESSFPMLIPKRISARIK